MSNRQPPLYEQIKSHLVSEMNSQRLQPHDKLPSENELSRQFSVSRITVKKALADLVKAGRIYRIQGKGTFVADFPPKTFQTEPKRKPAVAVLLPYMNNQHTALLLNGVERVLSEAGYSLLFANTENDQTKEEQKIRDMVEQGVCGLIVYPVDGESYNREILQLTLDSFPLVVMDRYLRGIDTNFVCTDNFKGAREGTAYLISLGHRHIGFISTRVDNTSSVEDRLAGYERALADHQIPIDHRYRIVDFEHEGSKEERIKSFLLNNPEMTAIFAVNAGLGLQVMKYAAELGIRVPEELSLIFFDDFELSEFYSVRPTYISQDEKSLGMEAARLLISMMEQPAKRKNKLFLPPKLIVRESTAPAKTRLRSPYAGL
jgi:DNA-binding LacI/PurR family transcriptional regulator